MKSIIIIVDMQKGFTRNEQTMALTEKIRELLKRRLFDVVIATRFYNEDNSIYEKMFGWHGLKTAAEREVPQAIAEYVDYYEDKYIYNCVNTSFIQRLCQLNDGIYPEKVFVVGVDTDCCVMSVATSLFENNIRPIVLTKYIASNGGQDSHNAGLLVMKRLIGQNQLSDADPVSRDDLNSI